MSEKGSVDPLVRPQAVRLAASRIAAQAAALNRCPELPSGPRAKGSREGRRAVSLRDDEFHNHREPRQAMASARTASDVRKTAAVIQAALAAVSVGLATLPAQAGELPTFRHGLWEFTRTLDMGGGEKTISARRCTEPGEEMSRQNAMLAKAGCTVSPVSRQRSSGVQSPE